VQADKFYDEYWTSGVHRTPEWDEQSFRRCLSPLVGLDTVLDYGCGQGFSYQRRLASSVKTYVGADVAEAARANARQKGFAALKIDPDTSAIDSPDNRFDGAACIEVFEHLFDPLKAARELNRVLKPGGLLVTTVPNFGYHAWRMLALLRAQVPMEPHSNRYDGVHIRFFSKLMFTRLLGDAGFVEIKISSWDHGSIWDVFWATGPFGAISNYAKTHFPEFMHLRFLQDLCPNVFAQRLRATAWKPKLPA
jgi:SAM-dependent methyltransferase